jgi:hypothetical protein
MGVFATFQKNIDLVPDFYREGAVSAHELGSRDGAFRFVTDIDDDVVRANVDDLSLDDIALFHLLAPKGFLEERCKALL